LSGQKIVVFLEVWKIDAHSSTIREHLHDGAVEASIPPIDHMNLVANIDIFDIHTYPPSGKRTLA
jgi:hypothetical protein